MPTPEPDPYFTGCVHVDLLKGIPLGFGRFLAWGVGLTIALGVGACVAHWMRCRATPTGRRSSGTVGPRSIGGCSCGRTSPSFPTALPYTSA